jgi:hypothetical protein
VKFHFCSFVCLVLYYTVELLIVLISYLYCLYHLGLVPLESSYVANDRFGNWVAIWVEFETMNTFLRISAPIRNCSTSPACNRVLIWRS